MGKALYGPGNRPATAADTAAPFFPAPKEPGFFGASGEAERSAASHAAAGASQAAAEPPTASALRTELLKLMDEFERATVGQPVFDPVITKDAWDKLKAKEAAYKAAKEQYDKDLAAYKANPAGNPPKKPAFVAVYTTCIAVQSHLLKEAFKRAGGQVKEVGNYGEDLKLKKGSKKIRTFGYGTTGPVQAAEIGAWTSARPGLSARPKPGDLIILAFRGSTVDKAADEVSYTRGQVEAAEKKDAKADELVAARQAALEAAQAAEAELRALDGADESAVANKLIAAAKKTSRAAAELKVAEAAAEKTERSLAGTKAQAQKSGSKLDRARQQMDHDKVYEFSHVGLLKSITPDPATGTEIWETFDGGQTLQTEDGAKQGAASGRRVYHPDTNEITGEASQGGKGRWLQGWIDVDKLKD